MEHPSRGYWALDFQDNLTGKGRPVELLGGGMPGPSGNEDGNVGTLPAPAYNWHRGWEKFPSSKITTVSIVCRCRKCTYIAVLVATRPGHPSIGQLHGPHFAGKVIWKVRGPVPVAGFLHCRRVSATLPC